MSFGAFLSRPSARGRVLVHVVDLDDGSELRLRARGLVHPTCSETGAPIQPGDRVRRRKNFAWMLAKGRRRSLWEGVYAGLFWALPGAKEAA